jgi:hypothetical protein
MKRSYLILGLIVWSGSLALAFFVGRAALNGPVQPTQSIQPSLQSLRSDNVRAVDAATEAESPARLDAETEAATAVAAIFDGSVVNLSQALAEVAKLSPTETKDFIAEAMALSTTDPKRSRILTALLEQLAQTNPVEAYEMTATISSLRDAERAKTAILEVWGKNDPLTALNWAASVLIDEPDHLIRAQMRAIYEGYAENNAPAAFSSALALPKDGRDEIRLRNQLLATVVESQIRDGQVEQVKQAIALMSDEDSGKENLVRELVSEWAKYDPLSAAGYIDALGDQASSQLKSTLVEQWADSDPAAAASWLSRLDPEDPTISRAASSIIREWTRHDLNASAEWLNSLPASPELDRAVASYTYRAAQEDPGTAMTWAESISNDWVRDRMMQSVAVTWRAENPEAFEGFLESSELDAEQKEKLRNAESRGSSGRSPFGGRR